MLCKPHKRQGSPKKDRQRFSQTRKIVGQKADLRSVGL